MLVFFVARSEQAPPSGPTLIVAALLLSAQLRRRGIKTMHNAARGG